MNFTRKDFDLNDEYMRRKQKEAQHEQLVQLVSIPNLEIKFTLVAALEICKHIQKEQLAKWYTFGAWRCRRCIAQARDGIPARLARNPAVCSCPLVAAHLRYAYQTP